MGSRQDIGFLGIIGYIMQQSSTVRLALDALHEHLTLHHEKGQTGVASYGDVSGLYWNNPLPFEEQHYTNEAAMAQAAVVLRAIIGNQFRAKTVHFTHRAPADIKPYKQIFKAPVYFNQAKNEIIFERRQTRATQETSDGSGTTALPTDFWGPSWRHRLAKSRLSRQIRTHQ